MSDKDDIIAAIQAGFQSVSNGTGPSSVSSASRSAANASTMLGGSFQSLVSLIALGATPSFAAAATALELVSKGATVLADNWRAASQTGLYFSNNMVGYTGALAQAQLTTEDLNRTFKQVGPGFAGLGPGLEGATRRTLELGAAYQSSDIIDSMRNLGYNTAQANELVAIQAASNITGNAKKKITDAELFDNTLKLAQEFAAVTEVAGISRKKQLEALQQDAENESLQLAFDQLGPGLKENYTKLSKEFIGTGMTELGRAIISQNGVLTQKQGEQLAILQGPGQQFYKAMMNYSAVLSNASATDKEKAEAEKRVREANTAVTDLTRTTEFQRMARLQAVYSEQGSELGKFVASISQANRITRQNTLEGEDQLTAQKRIKAEQEANRTTKQKETDDAQKALSEAINKAGRIVDMVQISSATALMQVANAGGGLLVRNAGILDFMAARNKDGTPGALTPENAENKARLAIEVAKSLGEKIPPEITNALAKISEKATGAFEKYTPMLNEYIEKIYKKINVDPNPRSQGSPGIVDFLSGSSSFNSMFENFGTGTLATLHGMEAVVRPEQLSGIINKATAQATAALPAMTSQAATAPNQFAQINPEVFNEMKNQLAILNSLMASNLSDISSTMTKQYSALRDLNPDLHS
jgi:hypothetical protein